MDDAKCQSLKADLAGQPEPRVVPVERFFDGNDDLASIGCNLDPHPGVGTFRQVLAGLLRRPDVQAVYAQISELDPGEGCWPFSDTILVVGSISSDELRRAVRVLMPDEVSPAEGADTSSSVIEPLGSPISVIWWD